MCLWCEGDDTRTLPSSEAKSEDTLRLQGSREPGDEVQPGIPHLDNDAHAVSRSIARRLQDLWRTWNYNLRQVEP